MGAIFLDRDGVLNEYRHDYVKSWDDFRWIAGCLEALVVLATLAVPIVVVTNQSIVGRGLAEAAVLEDIHRRMLGDVRARGGRIDAIYSCVHTPEAGCACRKPRPGLLRVAAAQHGISLPESVLVGDASTDYAAAQVVGTRYVHVRTGRGAGEAVRILAADAAVPVVPNLLAAAPLCAGLFARQSSL